MDNRIEKIVFALSDKKAEDILETIMRDEEILYKFLIGGLVFTGNDNTSNNDKIMKNHRNEKNR